MDNLILKYWPVLIVIISFIAWLVRLESKVKEHSTSINKLEESQEKSIEKITDKLDRVDDKISALGERISELTGYLKRCEEEK